MILKQHERPALLMLFFLTLVAVAVKFLLRQLFFNV